MNWKYCVSRNVDAKNPKNVSVMVADAAEDRGFLKKRTSSIGRGVCDSHHANNPRKTAPPPTHVVTTGANHPLSGAWMMPYSRNPNPMIDRAAPSGSRGLSWRSLVLGMNRP